MQLMGRDAKYKDLEARVRNLMKKDACFVMRARRLSRLVTRAYDEALRDCEITGSQFTLLFSIAAAGPLQAVTLANELDIEKSTLSRTVKRMLESGWLEERRENGKPKTLALTNSGRRVLEESLPHWENAQNHARKMFAREGSNALNHLIDKAHTL